MGSGDVSLNFDSLAYFSPPRVQLARRDVAQEMKLLPGSLSTLPLDWPASWPTLVDAR